MTPTLNKLVEEAYARIDAQTDYKIPRLTQWKKTHKVEGGKVLSACVVCGDPVAHAPDKHPLRCLTCRKKVSELFQKRNNKNFFKNPAMVP